MGNNPIGHVGVEALLKGIVINVRLRLVGLEVRASQQKPHYYDHAVSTMYR